MSPQIVFPLFAFILGAVVGSFLNVCIWRLPREESVVSPPSHCPGCDAKIRFYDNIPLLSYLLLGGRCRFCRTRISPQYPLVEFLNGLLALFLFLKFGPSKIDGDLAHLVGPSLTFLVLFVFSSALVAITFIDLEHQIIPDVISLPGIVAGFLCSFVLPWNNWLTSLLGILLGGGSLLLVASAYEFLTKKEGMGGGDVKLLAMMGAFLGWRAVPFIIFTASLAGSVIGLTLMFVQKKDSKLAIPFGPFLAFGALLFIFYGRQMIAWYFGLAGRM